MVTLVASVAVVVLAAVLVLAATIGSLRGAPRSGWLSFAGGVAVTYVFLKLLPELARAQQKFEAHHPSGGWLGEHRLFLFSLAGATVLLGIERAAKRTKREREQRGEEARSAAWVFWLHGSVMAAYVAFIGYLLFREGEQRVRDVAVLGAVMALHLSGTAVALADDYGMLYMTRGRWLLAAAALAGGAAGYAWKLPDAAFHLLLGVLAGAVVVSVVKEEIPSERQGRFWALAAGVVVAGALLWAAG